MSVEPAQHKEKTRPVIDNRSGAGTKPAPLPNLYNEVEISSIITIVVTFQSNLFTA